MKQELIGLIRRIPYGMVSSYGELASQLDRQYGIHTSGRMVGRMLSSMSPVEWKGGVGTFPRRRVINRQGVVSTLKLGEKGIEQIRLLQAEGIQVVDGQVNMKVYEYSYLIPVPSPFREGGSQDIIW